MCASRTSPAADLMEPVMILDAWCWTDVSFLDRATNTSHLDPVEEGWISVNQMSAAYVKIGIAMVV